jgi:hypothetical protein
MCTGCPGSGPFSAKVYLEVGPRTLCRVNNWGKIHGVDVPEVVTSTLIGMYQKREKRTQTILSVSKAYLSGSSLVPLPGQLDAGQGVVSCTVGLTRLVALT